MMASIFKDWKLPLLIIISIISYYWFAYQLDRTHFLELLICFALSFGAYVYIMKKGLDDSLPIYMGLGIIFRCIFLFSLPLLSDDYFRFIWDGHLITAGQNPFDLYPAQVGINFPNKEILLEGMNSPNYYTVYPPIAQIVYYLGATFSPNSILGSIVVMRSIILLAEIGTIFLLPKLLQLLELKATNSLWYALNPLVIVELTGNLHFEAIMIFFFLLAIYLLVLQNAKLSLIPWALAAGTKLIPIFFLPLLFRKYKLRKLIPLYLIFGFTFLILWLPFYNETLIPHFKESVNLYYKTFEFNASIYYIFRWVGFQLVDYNIIRTIGPWLSRLALFIMLIILLRKQNSEWKHFFKSLLFALSVYYLFALIVHPWYCCFLVFLSVFTSYRYAMIWSGLIILSYWAYSNVDYQENYILIVLEYLIVLAVFFQEIFRKKFSFLSLGKSLK